MVSFLISLWGVYVCWKQHETTEWPTADATVIKFDPGDYQPDWEGSWYANPRVEYIYEVEGKEFVADHINPSPFNYQSKDSLRRDFGGMSTNAASRIWYNPRKKSDAYLLNKGITIGPVVTVFLGMGFAVLALVGLRKKRDAEHPHRGNARSAPEE